MAKDKKSFLLYADIKATVDKLPMEKRGELFSMILDYVNDENPTTNDLLIEIAFEPIKQQLKRDLREWETKREKRSESGRLGGLKSGEIRSISKQNEAKEANASLMKQNEANEAVNVTANVTANVNDKEKNKEEAKEEKIWRTDFENYLESLRQARKEIISDVDWIKQKERYHPNVDIILSIEKSCVEYWSKEAGWKKKKSDRKTVDIDWKSTFSNALNLKSNLVYKQK